MSYLEDVQLKELDETVVLEVVCLKCQHEWLENPTTLLLKVMHRDVYLDEVAKNLACKKPHCTHVGVRLAVVDNSDTSGFVGGMP